MFSFMNAGSGSNQSNHLYKLGPIHQGIKKILGDEVIMCMKKTTETTLEKKQVHNKKDKKPKY
jgi:hypothetical protein